MKIPSHTPSRHLIALRKAESSAESVRFVTLWKGRRGRKTLDGPHQQPAEPYAFPPATFTDPVHAVAPVARARQTMFAVLKRLGLEQAVDVALPRAAIGATIWRQALRSASDLEPTFVSDSVETSAFSPQVRIS